MSKNRNSYTTQDPTQPIWCQLCYVRIAPYDRRAMKNGKAYHPGCYSKITQRNTKARNGRG